jgi:FkbM family methyltransferase
MVMSFFDGVVEGFGFAYRVGFKILGFLRPIREGETFFGAKLQCNIKDFIARRIYFFRIYEHNLTYLFCKRINAGDIVVDVGANIGYFTLLASNLTGRDGKVISFEVSPDTFDLLTENIRRNNCENVSAYNVAATLEECRVTIYRIEKHNAGANQIRTCASPLEGSIRGCPISRIIGSDISRVHFIKIDIEGSEGPVLQDILLNLDKFPRRLTLVVEISGDPVEYVAALKSAGFEAVFLPNNYSIGYYLVRRYLQRIKEDDFAVLLPTSSGATERCDYVFTRS